MVADVIAAGVDINLITRGACSHVSLGYSGGLRNLPSKRCQFLIIDCLAGKELLVRGEAMG